MIGSKQYLGKRIQELRKQSGLKQSELAEMANIDCKHLSKIECGIAYPSLDLLDKIAKILNQPTKCFFEIEHLQDRKNIVDELKNKIETASTDDLKVIYRIVNSVLY